MEAFHDVTIERDLTDLPGWIRLDGRFEKSFVCDDFHSAVLFVERVAAAAEAVRRYPELSIHDNLVRIAFPLRRGWAETAATRRTLAAADHALARRIERLTGDQHHHPVGLAGR